MAHDSMEWLLLLVVRGVVVEKESRAVGVGGSDKKKTTKKEIKWVELGDRQFDYRVIAVE